MVNKNKAAAKVVTADSTLRMMIEDQKCYRYNLFLHFNKNFSIFLEFFFLYKIVKLFKQRAVFLFTIF